jgi:ribosomal protein S19
LRARYPVLAPPRKTTPIVSPKQKRAVTANASKKMTASVKPATKKRSMTSQPEELEMDEQATPIRRSSRMRTPTPNMVEAKFGFYINTKNLPSRENPGIKSKRFKGDW